MAAPWRLSDKRCDRRFSSHTHARNAAITPSVRTMPRGCDRTPLTPRSTVTLAIAPRNHVILLGSYPPTVFISYSVPGQLARVVRPATGCPH